MNKGMAAIANYRSLTGEDEKKVTATVYCAGLEDQSTTI